MATDKYESSGPCGFREEDFFLSFSHDAPGAGPVWTPGVRLAGFIKRTTIHCYTQNMKALGLVVSEKKIFFYVLPMTPPGRGPYVPPGTRLAGFIKRTTIHCYTQNMKALDLVVSEKKIFFYVFPIVSLLEQVTPTGRGPYGPQGHDWQGL